MISLIIYVSPPFAASQHNTFYALSPSILSTSIRHENHCLNKSFLRSKLKNSGSAFILSHFYNLLLSQKEVSRYISWNFRWLFWLFFTTSRNEELMHLMTDTNLYFFIRFQASMILYMNCFWRCLRAWYLEKLFQLPVLVLCTLWGGRSDRERKK